MVPPALVAVSQPAMGVPPWITDVPMKSIRINAYPKMTNPQTAEIHQISSEINGLCHSSFLQNSNSFAGQGYSLWVTPDIPIIAGYFSKSKAIWS